MESDKQLYRIFQTRPDWVFELAGLPSVGPSVMQSVTVKSIERRTDGVIVPRKLTEPTWVVEFQDYLNPQIYTRLVSKMASVQEEQQMRSVRGLIFFGAASQDPKTDPWNQIIQSHVLPDDARRLAGLSPQHPLVAVLRPLVASTRELEHNVGRDYETIERGKLNRTERETLLDVFFNWLGQRFPDRSHEEIKAMYLKDAPPIEETRMGKDLIEIGEARALARAVLKFLDAKPKPPSKALRRRIQSLHVEQLNRLLDEAVTWDSSVPLQDWLNENT